MGGQNEGGFKAFTANVALAVYRRVKLVAGSGVLVEYAGADEDFIGVTQQGVAQGARVTVRMRTCPGTFKVEAAGAIVVGAAIYGASNGRIDDTVSGQRIGTMLEVLSAAGEVGECCFDALARGSIGDAEGLFDRYSLIERFEKKPNLNADLLPAGGTDPTNGEWALLAQANRDFELLGTSAVSAQSALDAGGGVKLTTAGAANDQCIITPHLDTSQSAWAATDWLSQKELEFGCLLQTGVSVINTTIWAGLKLTNTQDPATDADQAYFKVQSAGTAAVFHCITEATSVADDNATTITVAVSTHYRLELKVGADRVVRFYINGTLVSTNDALTTAIAFIPYIGVMETTTTTGKILYARWAAQSRKY